MRQVSLRLHHELVVESFAGGGGASLGIEWALGRSPDVAINHDAEAIAMHAANHPDTRHYCESVWDVDPLMATNGRPVGLMWLSPDCTFHSKARGGQPFRDRNRARRRRGLAWVAIRWARSPVRPRIICLENVEEFQEWGPLGDDGKPCPKRRGATFQRFVAELRNLGYQVEWRQMRACDYGAPTTRRRLFLIARCDGQPIVWPEPTHGAGRLPYRTAAECISWELPCPSIFERQRPLAEKTLARIARGLRRYVIDAAEPFIIPVTHAGDLRVHGIREPLRTVTGAKRGEQALISPTLIQQSWGERQGQAPRALDIHQPLGTIVAGGIKHALVSAFLAKHYGGHEGPGSTPTRPLDTITVRDHHALVAAHLSTYYGEKRPGDARGSALDSPLPTQTTANRHALVRAFLLKYYGAEQDPRIEQPLHTITTRHRFGLVTVHGTDYVIADLGMRMLVPRELFRAQGFPESYVIDVGEGGVALTKTAQVRMCGNSVPPHLSQAIVAANYSAEQVRRVA